MLPQEVIRRKRDGTELDGDAIRAFVDGLTTGAVKNEQVSAFAMAVFFRGMSLDERVALTLAMRDSGRVMSWEGFDGPIVDKHSTGGIGDTVSLMLAPALAACGCYVPMISGRGLGHTGGTLDKLDSIPGYRTNPDHSLFQQTVREAGCAIIGQTDDLAPADRKFYAIRDVTGTVESLDLITASILSKKLAAGLGGLVLDVKCGSGAFMATRADAQALAESLVTVANGAGTRTTALLTDMNEPLADAAGNALEVGVAVDMLTGRLTTGRLYDITLALGATLLFMTGQADSEADGHARMIDSLESGHAAERFARMVRALGGPADFLENSATYLSPAPVSREVIPQKTGFVRAIDTRAIGIAVIELGGGRRAVTDPIDPSVGFSDLAGIGDNVGPDVAIATVHAGSVEAAEQAANRIRGAYRIGPDAPDRTALILDRISA
ncbi:MAG: thymidine phosphorylase [Pseudomonadota bacterium]